MLSRDVLRPAVLMFTVKRSLTDRGFLASIHFARPLALVQGAGSEGGSGRLEVRGGSDAIKAHRKAQSVNMCVCVGGGTTVQPGPLRYVGSMPGLNQFTAMLLDALRLTLPAWQLPAS